MRRYVLCCALLASACGPSAPSDLTELPRAVSQVAGTDNQSAGVGEAVAVRPAVKVVDRNNNAVFGATVSFTVITGNGQVTGAIVNTGVDGVATVGSWVLGPTPGINRLRATVDAPGVTGNPVSFTATSVLTALNPSANTSLSGNRYYSSVSIPAGVVITVKGALTLNVAGPVTIAGSLVGDCQPLVINAEGALSVSGTIDNGCPSGVPPAGAPALTLVGKGGYSFTGGATVLAGGNVTITDDPTATDADFAPAASPPAAGLRLPGPIRSVTATCNLTNLTGAAKPSAAPAMNPVRDAGIWIVRCKGGADLAIGTISLTAQHGSVGLDRMESHDSTPAVVFASGGPGGNGGTVKLQAVGSITLGAGTIRTGDGGSGGNAVVEGTAGQTANAFGGPGAFPGRFVASAKNGSLTLLGSFTLQLGNAGDGGAAIGIGGDGQLGDCFSAVGGWGSASGGAGGTTPDRSLNAAGGFNGFANLTVSGGAAGNGGKATAVGGRGAVGIRACKAGGAGGGAEAFGGLGGDANLTNQNGVLVANGGKGGDAEFRSGTGGRGWSGCTSPVETGGSGGRGGSAAGTIGSGGHGLAPGGWGEAILNAIGNGGDGGNGAGPGPGGPPGENGLELEYITATLIQPSFIAGKPGNSCS